MTRTITILLLTAVLTGFPAPAHASGRRRVPRAPSTPSPLVVVTDDFRLGTRGWNAGFADYLQVHESSMEIESGLRQLPPELGTIGTGYFLTAHNRSDDVFMFLAKKLSIADGIRPNQKYEITFRIRFASNAGGENCVGIGGHPGFSVYLKAGGSPEEPLVIQRREGDSLHYEMNVDKGNQSVGGPAASVAGHISTGSADCSESAKFVSLERIHHHTHVIAANPLGELWLLVGTDSGFEGKSRIYYESISATLAPLP